MSNGPSGKLGKHLKAMRDQDAADNHRLNLVNTDAVDFVPCGEMVLAEKIDMDRTAAGLHLIEDSALVRWRCTDVGPDVKRVKVGDEFIVGNNAQTAREGGVMFEVPGRTLKTRLIHQAIIICIVRLPEPGTVLGGDGIPRLPSTPSLLEP